MLDKLIFLLSLLATGQVGTGTIFGSSSWDRTNPHSRLACDHREIDDKRDFVVAHNTLPCHTPVWVYNPRTGLSVMARVADRGPKHAMVDLSKPVAKHIAHNGMETVLVVPMPDGVAPPRTQARPGHVRRRHKEKLEVASTNYMKMR